MDKITALEAENKELKENKIIVSRMGGKTRKHFEELAKNLSDGKKVISFENNHVICPKDHYNKISMTFEEYQEANKELRGKLEKAEKALDVICEEEKVVNHCQNNCHKCVAGKALAEIGESKEKPCPCSCEHYPTKELLDGCSVNDPADCPKEQE